MLGSCQHIAHHSSNLPLSWGSCIVVKWLAFNIRVLLTVFKVMEVFSSVCWSWHRIFTQDLKRVLPVVAFSMHNPVKEIGSLILVAVTAYYTQTVRSCNATLWTNPGFSAYQCLLYWAFSLMKSVFMIEQNKRSILLLLCNWWLTLQICTDITGLW